MKKIEIYTEGLTCANCAAKIETKLGKLPGVSMVSVDAINAKIKMTYEHLDPDLLFNDVKQIVDETEKGVTLSVKKENHQRSVDTKQLARIVAALALLALGYGFDNSVFHFLGYVLIGYDVLFMALRNVLKGDFFDENFLMSIATLGALFIGEAPEALAVMLFYQVGELFQEMAISKSRNAIHELVDLKVDSVHVLEENVLIEKKAEDIKVGEVMVVRKGEKVALDGVLLHKEAWFDQSALTGESKAVLLKEGDVVYAGSLNKGESITLQAVADVAHSSIAKMLEMMEEASGKKAKSEQFITKFARVYTPSVVGIALLLFVGLVLVNTPWHDALYRALIFLVISCPCALVISIPLSFFAAIGKAGKMGVLVKGGQYLESLQDLDTIAFDKTGTLTKGNFAVTSIECWQGSQNDMMQILKSLEAHSTHPIALAIARYAEGELLPTASIEEYSGEGIVGVVADTKYGFGNSRLMQRFGVQPGSEGLYLAKDGTLMGKVVVEDAIKENAYQAVQDLKAMGIKLHLLSGDHQEVVDHVGESLQLDSYQGELLPQGKLEALEALKESGSQFAFIGDGINDAPALSLANVGIAMGAMGSDLALESADIILLNDDLESIAHSIQLSKKTRTIVTQNIVFVLAIKAITLVLGALGLASMWMALFADVGVSLLAILNSIRLLKDVSPQSKSKS
ncbi:MAG: heavy metal translocating P-type ATPase [Erysipelotrichaceae bacterium]